MKEIEFRAWDVDLKRMIYPDIIHLGPTNHIRCGFYIDEKVYFEDCEHFILLKYTGLKDKNGKKAYFDDIYITKVGNVVIIKDSYTYEEMATVEEDFNTQEPEIIGNIYENPNKYRGICRDG